MTAAAKLVIVEPCLEPAAPGSPSSHAEHLVVPLLAATDRRGVLVARHGVTRPAGLPPGCILHDTLTFGPHAKVTAAGELDRLDDRGRARWRPQAPWAAWHRSRRREQRVAAFARGVAPALAALGAGDVVLVSTASDLEVAGLARAIAAAAPPPGIGWHLWFHTPFERGFLADRPRQGARLARVAAFLAEARRTAAGHVLQFHATTAAIAAQVERLAVGPCDVLPWPVVVPPPDPAARSGIAPLRIAALGDARPEKNSHRLAEIVDAAAALPVALSFTVQGNPGFAAASTKPEHDAVRRCLTALRGRPNVELLAGPLDEAAYVGQLHRADVVLLAYDQDRYRTRLSAILLEALATGAVPIVTGGGWMGRQLAEARRDHAARIAASATGRQRLGFVRTPAIGRSGLTVHCAVPAGTAALLVAAEWTRRGREALAEPPLRVGLGPDGAAFPPLPVTVACAPTTGDAALLLLPLPPSTAPRTVALQVGPVRAAAGVVLATLAVDALAGTAPPPAAAAGVIVDDVTDVPGALAEVARHSDHYRRSAAALGVTLAAIHSPAALLGRLER